MGHRAYGIYVHITWHTRLRQRVIRAVDAQTIKRTIIEAARRWQVHVHEVAILTEHVHVIASFRPEACIQPFVRHAKSEAARRINQERGQVLQWARGYFVQSLSRSHVRPACAYVAGQFRRHPDRVPS